MGKELIQGSVGLRVRVRTKIVGKAQDEFCPTCPHLLQAGVDVAEETCWQIGVAIVVEPHIRKVQGVVVVDPRKGAFVQDGGRTVEAAFLVAKNGVSRTIGDIHAGHARCDGTGSAAV